MEEEISATPVILITEDTTQINKSPSDIPIIPKNTKDNTKYNTISASTLSSLSSPPSSPSLSPPLPRSPSSPSSPPSSPPRSSSSFFSRVSQTPLLKRSLTKVFSSPLPDDNINNNNREKKLEKKASIFEILSPFNSKAKRERALSKCASSPNLEVMSIISKSKKDCSISIKVFEARNIPEARKRKKITEKNITTIRRAQKMIGEISSPNLMSFSDATDPYCMVEVDRTKMRTRTIEKKLNPFWCEEFSFEVLDPAKSKVVLTLIDDKKYSPNGEVLGRLVLPINSFRDQREREQWFPIQPPSSSKRIPQVQMFIDYTTGSDRKSMFKFQIIGGRNVGLGVGGAVPQLDFSWKLKDSKTKENSWSWTEIHALATDIELPAHLETFQITLWKWKLQNEQDETQSGERQKTILGQVSIPVVDLSEARAYWFCLFGKDAGFGDLRVKVKYTEEVVLTMAHYQEFLELLQEENLTIVRTLAEVAKPNMREAISFNLFRLF